ncbi:hypothetical protein ANOM_011797 [Aspergillus nomiae NRRL 13137]|uniref:Sugar transporter n=1 Tax=Aspergillus nomiae NRRL (strain ATCC 15546 / NRRL 13137 / CBS 260.88 / M93) TaxID=1509407 RepID=A0A0L1IK42_ASPN3|nr:uncharacterized protein ANOM_011797 [Aspergillus nomiae NRRL 13137]KNG79882.1 hypothetical protein ANOM_011797 [Aspergillus nomiae NRRL 13137]
MVFLLAVNSFSLGTIMAGEIPHTINDGKAADKNVEAQSTFASTLVVDVEKSLHGKETDPSKSCVSPNGMSVSTPTNQAGSNPVYAAKAQLLNQALLDMQMGLYQWVLFIITSAGWSLDSFWIMSFVVIAPSASNEAQFFFAGDKSSYLFVSLAVGLTVGATAWPWMSDILGRRWIFTSTIVLMGMGGLVGAGMPSFTGLCVVGFVVGFAVAGNQLVTAIILIESLPASHQFLLTVQGAFWGLGQVVSAAVGWAFIAGYTCGTGPDAVSTSQALSTHSSRDEAPPRAAHPATTFPTKDGATHYLYTSLCAIPGPLAAGILIQTKRLGRTRTGSAIALLTGLFMLLATLARSRNALLAFECILSFLQFAGLAVLTTYTVETFAAPVRGFGVAIMGFWWGLFALVAVIVNTFAGGVVAGGAAVWFCGAVWVLLAGAWWRVPETRGGAAA